MIKQKLYIPFILALILLISCKDENILYLDFQNLNGNWHKNNEIEFNFESSESVVDISLILRTDNLYPFSNIFLISSIKNGNKNEIDTISYAFENDNKKWYDAQVSSIKNSKISVKKHFKIDSGLTNFKVKHAIRYLDSIMPQTKLDGILDVGLIVEKSNK
tara:strand:+ start:177 stop:659 length:483 start_codon:yes stop_codon:yes gene_type:complete